MMSSNTMMILGLFAGLGLQSSHAGAQEICGQWTQVDPPLAPEVQIQQVTALSASDLWAFGGVTGAMRFNGTSWASVPLPDLSGLGTGFGLDAMGTAGQALVVAGVVTTSTWTSEQLLLIWDGGRWDRVETLELAQNDFGQPRYGAPRAIAGVNADDLWIVGTASSNPPGGTGTVVLTARWDGSSLVEYITPGRGDRQNHLYGVAAIASDDVWAVGEFTSLLAPDNGALHGMTYHWDGTSWNLIPNPTETMDSVHLHEIVAIATNDVWAAGSSPDGPLFMHWDGSSWGIVTSPAMNGGVYQMAAIASDDIWAVRHPSQVPLISTYLHWDGAAWNAVAPPGIPGATSVNRAAGLAAAGPCDVWAVGSIDLGEGIQPYVERLQPAQGGVVPVPEERVNIAYLEQNSPNPFNPSTTITYRLTLSARARLDVYDLSGRHVVTLVDGECSAGSHTVIWNGCDGGNTPVVSGVYFYRLIAARQAETRRMALVR